VVAIDQLEELFTACEREQVRAAFLDQLAAAARDYDRRALVLGALRADFYGRLVSYPGFAQLLSSSHVLVGPMARDELARTIEEPASRAGLEVERPLVEALVCDVAGEPGGLPLLSTMLLELWRAREGRTLRFESYRTSGGARGAVARLAERAFGELGERERGVVRSVMLRLVSGEDAALVRRRAPLSELHSHEALLREWPRCRAWLEEDRVGQRLHAHLMTSAREWDTRGRDPGELYRGARLAGATDWAAQHAGELNTLEREFVAASGRAAEREARRQRSQNRRLRSLLLGVGVLLVVSFVVGSVALVKQHSASNEARAALGRQLGAEAVSEPRIDLAMLLAREAVNLDRSPQTAGALLATLLRSPAVIRAFAPPINAPPQQLAPSPDGRTLAVGDTADVRFYDPHTYAVQRPALTDYGGGQPIVYSSDGSLLAYATQDVSLSIAVRDAHTLTLLTKLSLNPFVLSQHNGNIQVDSILIAPDRRTVYCAYSALDAAENPAAAYLDRWSLPSGRRLSTMRIGSGAVFAVRLIDAGTRVVVVGTRDISAFDAHSLRRLSSVAMTPVPAPLFVPWVLTVLRS
jgi:hypothetical protein